MGCKSSREILRARSYSVSTDNIDSTSPITKDESPFRKSSNTVRFCSLNNLDNIASSGNIDSTFAISLPSIQEGSSKTLSHKLETRCSNNIRTQPLVFVFDTIRNKFISYNIQKNILQTNELNFAATEPSSESLEKILNQLENMSSIAVSDTRIHLIGEKHFVYDIKSNRFTLQPQRRHPTRSPLLYKLNETLFAISGTASAASDAFESYDIKTNTWHPLPKIPSPHVEGAVCGMVNQAGAQKLAVIGGYSKIAKGKKTPNSNLSIYDLSNGIWTATKLKMSPSKLKFLVRPRIFAKEEAKLIILTPELIMELDTATCLAKDIGGLPKEDKITRIESFCFTYKDQVALIGAETEQSPEARTKLKNIVLAIGSPSDLNKWNYKISLC